MSNRKDLPNDCEDPFERKGQIEKGMDIDVRIFMRSPER